MSATEVDGWDGGEQHGTAKRYHHGPDENGIEGRGCRCGECRDAARVERARQRAAGPQMVSSVNARRAVRKLRGYGWTKAAICSELGLSGCVSDLLCRDRCTRRVSEGVLDLLERERLARSLRLPLAPIVAELESRGATTVAQQAEWLEVDARQLYRWAEYGVPLFTADRLAVALERHPLTFWDDFYKELADAC